MKPYSKKIASSFFKKIHQVIPIVTIDLVVTSGRSFLLVLRKNNPEANTWYFPGGRLFKNEYLLNSAKRKLQEETGLNGKNYKLLGIHEHFYDPKASYFNGFGSHAVAVIFKVEVMRKDKISLDSQSLDFKWFTNIENNFNPYIKKFLRIANFK
jgi:ADP-ribose pyrophosphatase YjhB (NUDIX family)